MAAGGARRWGVSSTGCSWRSGRRRHGVCSRTRRPSWRPWEIRTGTSSSGCSERFSRRSSRSGGAGPAGSRAAGADRLRGGDGQQPHPQNDRGEGAGATGGPGQGRARRSVLRPRHAGRCDPGAGVARRGTAGRGPGGDRGHQLPRREWAESAVGRAPQRTRMDVVISAGRVITPSGDLTPGSVEISDGRIVAVRAGAAAEADLAVPDGVLAPGLIDLQINGAAGVDFLSPVTGAALTRLRRYLASTGVTAFLPTLITSPPALLQRALRSWQRAMHEPGAPRIVGVHLEGPYLNRQFKGAHPLRYLRAPDARHAAALLDAVSDTVRLVTLAPELPGAAAVIRALRERGCVVAAGHTAATYEQAHAAFGAGVTLVTHLFNAMRPVHHRDPGIVVAALEHPQVTVSLIADFIHVHPAVVTLAVRLARERVALITDAIAAAGASQRVTRLGTRTVRVTDLPRLSDGTIAGSVLSMDGAVRHVVSMGLSVRDAVLMASSIPARVLDRDDLGRIEVGKPADLGVLTRELRVHAVYAAGERIFGAA